MDITDKVYKWHIDNSSNEKVCGQTPSFELHLGMYFALHLFKFSNGVNSVAPMTTIWLRQVGNYSLSTPSNAMINPMLLETRVMLMLLKSNLIFCFDFFFSFQSRSADALKSVPMPEMLIQVHFRIFGFKVGLICQIKVCNFTFWSKGKAILVEKNSQVPIRISQNTRKI